jgi:hypothetical protein
MDLLPGELVLWMHDGVEEMVEIVTGPDENGFFTVKRGGQPNMPICQNQLKRPSPELEIVNAPSQISVEILSEWGKILHSLDNLVTASREHLEKIQAQVKAGERPADGILELRERELLISILAAIRQHRQSLIAILTHDSPN